MSKHTPAAASDKSKPAPPSDKIKPAPPLDKSKPVPPSDKSKPAPPLDKSKLGAPPDKSTVKRGRPAKPPPPPKLWRIEGNSPEGIKVTWGRYVTREEAEPEFGRLSEDGFYLKLKILESPNPEAEEEGTE